jgi:hypothetical protein
MECQLHVAQSHNLSLSLKKSFIFPKRVEFVGVDVCSDGNRPAQSKHNLLHLWKTPAIVRVVAKFVGFLQFYSQFIPNFEVRISTLWAIMLQDNDTPSGDYGLLPLKQNMMICATRSLPTRAYAISTIANCLSSAQISLVKGLDMLRFNQVMMLHCMMRCKPACKEANLLS